MFQFYLLSVIINFFAGIAAASDFLTEKIQGLKGMGEAFSRPGMKIFLGLCAFIIGIMKLIIPVRVPVAGDLIPAIMGLVLGITLMADFYKSKSDVTSETTTALQKIFLGQKSFFGILGIMVAFLHFIFPRVLFL